MNGFAILADAYRNAATRGVISQDSANKKCRIYEFLATCDQEDLCDLFDSSAFNEIAKSYMRLTVKGLKAEGTINEEQAAAIQNRFGSFFDDKQAREVLEQ